MMPNGTVFVVDDDDDVRDSLRALLESDGLEVRDFSSADVFLAQLDGSASGCVVTDIRMPGRDGLELQRELTRQNINLPVIVITGHGDVPLAVQVMKAGALDFIEKPFDDEQLLQSVHRAIKAGQEALEQASAAQEAAALIAGLTGREREVMELLIAGHPNKVIAYKLDISPRTVEVHRGRVMEKMQARSLSDLVRLALAAGLSIGP